MAERHRNVPGDFVRDPGRHLAMIGAIEAAEFSVVWLSLGGRMLAQRGVGEKIGDSHTQGSRAVSLGSMEGNTGKSKSQSQSDQSTLERFPTNSKSYPIFGFPL
jgi:hypothetical protein